MDAVRHDAEMRSNVGTAGNSIGPIDLLIVSQVRSPKATLVTGNATEFKRVEGLKVRDWHRAQQVGSPVWI